MDLTEANELLRWLEAEHRQSKTRLDALDAAVEQQARQIAEQNRLLQEWEGIRSEIQSELLKIPELEKAQARWREELLARVEKDGKARKREVDKLAKNQRQDRDGYQEAIAELRRRLDAFERQRGEEEERAHLLAEQQKEARQHLATQQQRLAELEKQAPTTAARLSLLASREDEVAAHLMAQQRVLDSLEQESKASAQKEEFLSGAQQQLTQRLAIQHEELEALKRSVQDYGPRLDSLLQTLGDILGRLSAQEEQWHDLRGENAELGEHLAILARREEAGVAHLAAHEQQLSTLRKLREEETRRLKLLDQQQDSFLNRLTNLEESRAALRSQIEAIQRSLSLLAEAQQDLKNQTVLLHQTAESLSKELAALAQQVQVIAAGQGHDRGEIANIQQQVAALFKEVKRVAEAGQINNADLQKLSAAIAILQTESADLARARTEQGEQLKLLTDARVSILGQITFLNEGQAAISRRVEAQTSLLQRWQQQHQDDMAALRVAADNLKKEQGELAEQLRLEQQRHRQRLNEWAEQVDGWRKELAAWTAQLRLFEEHHSQAQKVLMNTQELGKRLRQEYDEMKEMQRLNDERRQKELREWKGDSDKQWDNFLSEAQWHRNEQAKRDNQQNERLAGLEAWRQACETQLDGIVKRMAAHREEWREQIRELLLASAERARRQIAELQGQIFEAEKRTKTGGKTS